MGSLCHRPLHLRTPRPKSPTCVISEPDLIATDHTCPLKFANCVTPRRGADFNRRRASARFAPPHYHPCPLKFANCVITPARGRFQPATDFSPVRRPAPAHMSSQIRKLRHTPARGRLQPATGFSPFRPSALPRMPSQNRKLRHTPRRSSVRTQPPKSPTCVIRRRPNAILSVSL